MLLAVIESCAPKLPEPDPDLDVVSALRQTLRAAAAALNDPEWARVVPALLMLKTHEAGIRAIDERLEHEQHAILTALIERAVKEGVVAGGIDVPEAITHLLGPLLFAHLTELVPIDGPFADRLLEGFLAAYRPE